MFSIFEFDLVDGLSSVPVPWVSYDTDTDGQSKLDGYVRIRLRCVSIQIIREMNLLPSSSTSSRSRSRTRSSMKVW